MDESDLMLLSEGDIVVVMGLKHLLSPISKSTPLLGSICAHKPDPIEGCLVVVPHSLVVPGAQLMRKAGKLEDHG